MELTVVVHQEREDLWSEISELPGCFASGATLTELREALAEAVGLYLWDEPAARLSGELAVGECIVHVSAPAGRARSPAEP